MTNNIPWQVTMSGSNPKKASALKGNGLNSVKQESMATDKSYETKGKIVVMPKRYSFDDNGGGYRGL